MKKFFPLIFFILFSPCILFSQEFNINISVNSSQVQGTDKKVYETMQSALNELVKNRRWTKYNYKPQEKIEGSIVITIKERASQDDFRADLNIQLRRPVYNSSYTTTMLNTQEQDFSFKYIESLPLQFEENTYYDNLTSTVAFFLYYFLALDADSFSMNGGTEYFQICQNIVAAAQKCPAKGWRSYDSQKNKYWMSENYNNSFYRSMREANYLYHRMGLDRMSGNNQVEARNSVFEALEDVLKAYREKSTIVIIQQFIDAKADEIINIFKGAPDNEKERVVKIMTEINPANTSKYQQIIQTNTR